MFDSKIHGPLSVDDKDRDWASDLLAEVIDGSAAGARVAAPFSPLEQEVLRLGLLEGERIIARGAHPSLVARTLYRIVQTAFADRRGNALADPKLEALRRFTAATRKRRGGVDRTELAHFLKAGFSLQHALEVAICAVATSIGHADRHAVEELRSTLVQGIARRDMQAGCAC